VTLDDCAQVSRSLERWLEEDGEVPDRYVLEVSSPGIERPLVRPRDFERFAGQEVAVKCRSPVEGHGKRLQGRLTGLRGEAPDTVVRLGLEDGSTVDIPHADVVRAHLVFRWDEDG
jgi:ribosome maturation factor RimP